MSFLVSVDLGQAQDYTAVAIIQQSEEGTPEYHVRYLERFPIGTPYPAIVEAIKTLLHRDPLWSWTPVVVDATGVGAPVIDLMKRDGLMPVPIKIHGGQTTTIDDDGAYRVPKRDLASCARVLLESRRLMIAADLLYAGKLIEEMQVFKSKISISGHDTYEAWRERDHDDLVLAVAMGCWYGEHHARVPVFKGFFSPERHVSPDRVVPEAGIPIVRGWRIQEPIAVVWFQIDREKRCRVLFEHPPDAALGLRATKARVLAVSNQLYPDFTVYDYGEEDPEECEGRVPAWQILQPEIALVTRSASLAENLEVARDWLSRLVHTIPAVQIDPRCPHLITALAGGYAFRRVHGQIAGEVERNAHAAIVDAWLGALSNPVATMTPAQRARLAGLRDFGPPD